MNKFLKFGFLFLVLALFVVPTASFAQDTVDPNDPSTWPDAYEDDIQNNGGGGATGVKCSVAYSNTPGLEGFFNYLTCVLGRSVIPLLFALAFVIFIWGVVMFIANSGDEHKRTQGKQFMIWGIIGLFVMFTVWGLVQIVRRTVDPNAKNLAIPALPQQE